MTEPAVILYLPDDDGRPVPTRSYIEWSNWFAMHDPVLRRHTIGRFVVTTRWAGADTRLHAKEPRVWETTVHEVPSRWRWALRRLLGMASPYYVTWASSRKDAFLAHYEARTWAASRRWWL